MRHEHIQIHRTHIYISNRTAISVIKVDRCLNEIRIQQRVTYRVKLGVTLTECVNVENNDRHDYLPSDFSMPGIGLS
ncbi:Uncharacterised protein [Enterobacter cloacae]|nr:Uncharacterised protein [Enterobacter cloacae]